MAGAMGIIGTGLALAVRSTSPGEKSEINKSVEPTPEKRRARDELGVLN
jgi:hypothetical protein